MAAIDDLSDECFSRASQLVAELCETFADETDEKPTIDVLCEILCYGIRCCSDAFKDINAENVVALKAKMARRGKTVTTVGDVIAIPLASGDCFLGVYLGRFQIHGDAMGLLAGRHPYPCRPIRSGVMPIPLARPIFFHKLGITSGRWKIIDHRPEWANLFPNPPEYFYAKRYYPHDETIGPFGGARKAVPMSAPPGTEGLLRTLSENDAQKIGLLDRDFFQSGLVEDVEAYLNRLAASA